MQKLFSTTRLSTIYFWSSASISTSIALGSYHRRYQVLYIENDCIGDSKAIQEYDTAMKYLCTIKGLYLMMAWPLYIHHIIPSMYRTIKPEFGGRMPDVDIYYPWYNQKNIKVNVNGYTISKKDKFPITLSRDKSSDKFY